MASADLVQLIDRRAELLDAVPRTQALEGQLQEVTAALRAILDDDPPVVRRLLSESADEPGELARRLATKEPVHPVRDDADLRDRLAADRRCYLLTNDALPQRPFNVVWCALTRGVPHGIDELLDPSAPTLDPHAADTAVFYSIWNAEPGLRGLPGGRPLIEGAAGLLGRELPGIETFTTLSPLPGLRTWLESQGVAQRPADADLVRWAVTYLTSLDDHGRPLDPVARFHLSNGASLLAVRPGADPSPRALEQAYGMMANYRYLPEDRAANRALLADGRVAVAEGPTD